MAETTTAPPGTTSPPGDTSQSKAQEAASQATDKAQEVAGQAKDAAQQAAGQAKGRVREQVDQRSNEAGEQVSTVASDVRSVGEQLREQGKDGPAKLAEQAAERAEKVGSYLTESDADRILSDVEDFARKQPWVVVAGGLVAGFAASRFLKASSTQRYEQRRLSSADTQRHATTPSGGNGNGASDGYGTPTGAGGLQAPQGVNTPHTPPPPPPAPTGAGTPHTTPAQGHPAGTGVRSDRDVGGPTAAPGAGGTATGGAPGTRSTGLDPHR